MANMTIYEAMVHAQSPDEKRMNGKQMMSPAEARAIAGLPPRNKANRKKYIDPKKTAAEWHARAFGLKNPLPPRPPVKQSARAT